MKRPCRGCGNPLSEMIVSEPLLCTECFLPFLHWCWDHKRTFNNGAEGLVVLDEFFENGASLLKRSHAAVGTIPVYGSALSQE